MPEAPKNNGCDALRLLTNDELIVPVCMGGTAIAGCNRPDDCKPIYQERMLVEDPFNGYLVIVNEITGKVAETHRIAHQPLMRVEPPPPRE